MVILVAEDRRDVRLLVQRVLMASGFTVVTADDGEAALALSRNTPGSIDVLLTDWDMPRMNGLELSRRVAKERPGIKVLVMSGELSARREAAVQGLTFLQKPFSPSGLREAIETTVLSGMAGSR